jgi:uncharacterized protein (DUF1778 family)
MALKTRRLEARVDEATSHDITRAAQLSHQSVSGFVVGAAVEKANQILARADRTLMPAEQFDALMDSLNRTAHPIPALLRHQREWAFIRQ